MIWSLESKPGIVISTRIRLARNLDKIPFPSRLKDKDAVVKKVKDAIFKSNSTLAVDFEDLELSKLSTTERMKLCERHLISPQLLKNNDGDCLVNKDKTMSLMIMEEDHIRQQVIKGGYCPEEAYELCSKLDDVLSESLDFAFDEKIGYLTSCPTNAGTGLRVSVMLHLPALYLTGKLNRISASAANVGIAVRGYNGEGTDADGCFYQISNQITMGATEEEIIERVKNVTDQIVSFEEKARAELLEKSRPAIEDKVWRSYGILKYARTLTSKEALSLLSDVLFGVNMGIITDKINMPIMELIVSAQPAAIGGLEISPEERDIKRADFLREHL